MKFELEIGDKTYEKLKMAFARWRNIEVSEVSDQDIADDLQSLIVMDLDENEAYAGVLDFDDDVFVVPKRADEREK